MRIDLNEKRRARAEARKEPTFIVYGEPEQEFELDPEPPIDLVEALTAGEMKQALLLMLKDPDDVDRFMAVQPTPSIYDLKELADALVGNLGEALASPPSSTNGGAPSRPTG